VHQWASIQWTAPKVTRGVSTWRVAFLRRQGHLCLPAEVVAQTIDRQPDHRMGYHSWTIQRRRDRCPTQAAFRRRGRSEGRGESGGEVNPASVFSVYFMIEKYIGRWRITLVCTKVRKAEGSIVYMSCPVFSLGRKCSLQLHIGLWTYICGGFVIEQFGHGVFMWFENPPRAAVWVQRVQRGIQFESTKLPDSSPNLSHHPRFLHCILQDWATLQVHRKKRDKIFVRNLRDVLVYFSRSSFSVPKHKRALMYLHLRAP